MQKGITKGFFNGDNYLNDIAMVKAMKIPYAISISNYTMEINSQFFNSAYIQNMSSIKASIGAKMIERDIKAAIVDGFVPMEIDKHNLIYNKFSPFERLKRVGDHVYCIDIKQAYLTVLLNKGLITKETFKFCQALQKKDRLAAAGMLAKNKTIVHYDENGNKILIEKEENETSIFFYLCIIEVNDIMNNIRALLGNTNFIFYWVDGIYFEWEKSSKEIGEYLTSIGFKYTFEKLLNFQIKEKQKSYIISYWQEKTPEANRVAHSVCIKKRFLVNKESQEQKKKILEVLELYSEKNSIIQKFKTRNNKRII